MKQFGSFLANNMNKTGLNGCGYNFSVDYRAFDATNNVHINKYLMNKNIKYLCYLKIC